ncbi:MAG: zinc-ribbon domain-containing protein [Lachnospiraceae bacterium]|nr:zinc-ribbon domain-containing protein [Lachnospiraceae bacterium]
MAMIKCPECGIEIEDNVKVCPGCGYEMISSKANTQEITENKGIAASKNKKYIGIALFAAACILFIVAFTRVNNSSYSFYKEHYKECMEGYAECKLIADDYSGGLFRSTYENMASRYEEMANYDNKEIWKYRIQAIILCLGGFGCCIVGYSMVKGGRYHGVSKMS